jgi:hypothetical protein
MRLLKQLHQERAEREKTHAPANGSNGFAARVSDQTLCALETLYSGMYELADGFNQLEANARIDYEIESVGWLRNLHQSSYAVREEGTGIPRFVFVFDCVGTRPLTRPLSTRVERERVLTRLQSCGLSFSAEGNSAVRYVIEVKPIVPVRLEFAPSRDGNDVQLTACNLNRLDREIYAIHPDDVSEQLIDELGKLILRRENDFARLIGDFVSEEARERLRSRLKTDERNHLTPVTPRSSRRSDVTTLDGSRAHRQAPMLVADNDQVEGLMDWSTEPPASPASSTSTRDGARSGVFRFSRYAWVITKDFADSDVDESIAKRGPAGTSQTFPTPVIISKGDDFRLMSADGEVQYCGMILGSYQGLEPLSEFGRQHACCDIEYLREGNWVRFEPAE